MPHATPRTGLIVTPRLPPAVGGGESFGELLINALAASQWRVSVFTSAVVDAELSDVVRGSGGVIHLPAALEDRRSPWEQETFARSEQVHDILATDKTEAIFCLSHDSAITVALAVSEDLSPVPAVVGSYVDTSVLRTPSGLTRARFVYSLDRIGALLAESNFYKLNAVSNGFPAHRVVTASAVDIQRFSTADGNRGRRLTGVEDERRIILCASRFTPRKRIEDLLYVMAGLIVDVPDAILVIAGSAQSGSEQYQARIIDLVNRLELGSHCRVLTDLGRQDIADVTSASYMAVQTSEFEGLGRSALEAMAAGVCVIVTETSGFDEIVLNNNTGLTYPVGDTALLSTAMRQLFDEPALAERLRENARQWVVRNMSVDRLGRSAVDAYEIAKTCRP